MSKRDPLKEYVAGQLVQSLGNQAFADAANSADIGQATINIIQQKRNEDAAKSAVNSSSAIIASLLASVADGKSDTSKLLQYLKPPPVAALPPSFEDQMKTVAGMANFKDITAFPVEERANLLSLLSTYKDSGSEKRLKNLATNLHRAGLTPDKYYNKGFLRVEDINDVKDMINKVYDTTLKNTPIAKSRNVFDVLDNEDPIEELNFDDVKETPKKREKKEEEDIDDIVNEMKLLDTGIVDKKDFLDIPKLAAVAPKRADARLTAEEKSYIDDFFSKVQPLSLNFRNNDGKVKKPVAIDFVVEMHKRGLTPDYLNVKSNDGKLNITNSTKLKKYLIDFQAYYNKTLSNPYYKGSGMPISRSKNFHLPFGNLYIDEVKLGRGVLSLSYLNKFGDRAKLSEPVFRNRHVSPEFVKQLQHIITKNNLRDTSKLNADEREYLYKMITKARMDMDIDEDERKKAMDESSDWARKRNMSNRLKLLLGSWEAGNKSEKMKTDINRYLQKMHDYGYIGQEVLSKVKL